MVPKPLQKLGGDFIFYCVHSGNSARDCQFNSYVSYVLTLTKAHSIFYLHTLHMVRLSLNLS